MTPALAAALLRRPRYRLALVIHCGVPQRTTVPIAYERDQDTSAWYADLRARQAVGAAR